MLIIELGALVMVAADPRSLPDLAAELLNRKETVFPYYAEYDLRLPAMPTAAGRAVELRIYSAGRAMLYSDETGSTYSSRVLISDGKAYWEYEDAGVGQLLFAGETPLGETSPNSFLESRGFACNVFSHVDRAIPDILSGGAKSVRRDGKAYTAKLEALGTVRIKISDSELTMTAAGDQDRLLVRYLYREKTKPAWGDKAVGDVLKRFEDTDKQRVTLVGSPDDFSFTTLLNAAVQEGASRPIPVARLAVIASEQGYRLPQLGEILSAKGVVVKRPQKELSIQVRHMETEFAVLQMSPPLGRDALPEGFVEKTRKCEKYTVLRVHDPGTGARLTYYLSKEATFIIEGDHFEDKALQELILSFAPAADHAAHDRRKKKPRG